MARAEARKAEAAELPRSGTSTNNLEAFWMPFTANRQFKKAPRMLVRAEGMYYWTADGRKILDGTAGLWCVNAGHGRRDGSSRRSAARSRSSTTRRLSRWAIPRPSSSPRGWSPTCRRASTTCSSPIRAPSRSTPALKIALAYHRVRGEGSASA